MGVDRSRRTLRRRVDREIGELFQEYQSARWAAHTSGVAIGTALIGMILGRVADFFPDWSRTIYVTAGMFGAVALLLGAIGILLGCVFLVTIAR